MKLLRISFFAILAANLATFALAQYGLYGSPDSLRMPEQSPVPQQQAVPYTSYASPYAGQPNYAPQAYTQQPAAYNAPNGYVAPQVPYQPPYYAPTPYAPQPSSAQTGAQYSSPNPAYRTANSPRPAYLAQQASQPIPTNPPIAPDPMPTLEEMATPKNPGLTNPMPSEQGQTATAGNDGYVPYDPAGGTSGGACRATVNQYQEAACGGTDLGCGYNACPWYASISGLALTRTDANKLWTSYETGNNPNQIMNTQDARSSWKFGGEIRFGRRFCTGCCDPCGNNPAGYWAIEADYWTTEPFEGFASCTNPNTVSTPLRVSDMQFRDFNGIDQPGTFWFDVASEHRLWRRDEIQSVEINLVRGQWANVCGSNWDFAFSLGPRFFRFEEDLLFGSLKFGYWWQQDGGAWEAYLNEHITNNLWGGQLGLDLGYNCCGGALRFFATPKVGLYDNYITNYFQANLGNGTVATTGSSGVPDTYPVNSSTNTFSVMSQVDAGVEWFFAQRWSARVGYRVVAISGIGLADNQIPPYVVDIPAIADIDTNGDLILHGAFATLTFNF